ncbi:family 20 glycosylhydrolase [Streptosporangium sp. NPDC004379]|uniref:family 20 glycosylhydrolase n=1 Tax=Streptosporangium sp. NPDC004379 TaxID=3366189 RepID=UPI0036C5BA5A
MPDAPRRPIPPIKRLSLAALLAVALPLAAPAPSTATAVPEPVNLAPAGTAAASSVELDRPDFAAAHVIDGDAATRWSSAYADDNWVQVKLAEPSKVDHVTLRWPNACARDFVLQTSADGLTWTDVASLQRDTCPRVDVIDVGTDQPVSYVRMQGRKRWAAYGYSISEFEIWNLPQSPKPTLGLLPKPVSLTEDGGQPFVLHTNTRIVASGTGAQAPAEYLGRLLRTATGYRVRVAAHGNGPSPILLSVGPGKGPAGHEEEGYTLKVTSGAVTIEAATANGALNAVQTLRQLLPQWTPAGGTPSVPAVTITDYPRFAYRGVMLDVARSFYPVADVKRYIDTAAQYKINRLHLHLTDDQGWRIAMDTPADNPAGIDYGLLTRVSGATAMTRDANGNLMGTELGHTGFYTKADYTEIVRYAGENGMVVVPEIDLPGHTNAALHAVPQLNTAGSLPRPAPGQATVPANGTGAVGYSSLDSASPVTYEFAEQVLTQLARLTPGPYLHIGGDEAHSTGHDDYTKMVDAFTADVAGLGKTVMGWNEYSSTALPRDKAIVQYWNGDKAQVAGAVARRGARVVLSPASNTYVPQRQDPRQPQGGTWACGGVCGLDRHYGWDPGTFLPGVAESSVHGVESALWGEWIRGVRQAEYWNYPRVIATAEVGWTPQAQRDYQDFKERLAVAGGRLTVAEVNFFPTADVPWRIAILGTSGSPGQARWTVTAPGYAAGDLPATISWSDGVQETVTLTTDRPGSIPEMWNNGVFTAVSTRAFPDAGRYTGTLRIKRPGWAAVEGTLTVTAG